MLADDIHWVGELLDRYAERTKPMGVAAEDPEDGGVPPEMQVGEVNEEGWVKWLILPSTLREPDVAALESEFEMAFPPLFRAYLLARFHLFSQVKCARYHQGVMLVPTPARNPLGPLHDHLTAWRPLIPAGLLPFAEWGDGWGPMCLDTSQPNAEGECRVVWMDHERLFALGAEGCAREKLVPIMEPLYGTYREFLEDVFVRPH